MTYSELLTSLYKEHGLLLDVWKRSVELAGETGAFAFLPDSYVLSDDMKNVRFEFWPGSRLGAYLRDQGSTEDGYRELEGQIDTANEFLVFILEPPDTEGRRPVHVHRIGPVGHN
jgi:hypothetical protein